MSYSAGYREVNLAGLEGEVGIRVKLASHLNSLRLECHQPGIVRNRLFCGILTTVPVLYRSYQTIQSPPNSILTGKGLY